MDRNALESIAWFRNNQWSALAASSGAVVLCGLETLLLHGGYDKELPVRMSEEVSVRTSLETCIHVMSKRTRCF